MTLSGSTVRFHAPSEGTLLMEVDGEQTEVGQIQSAFPLSDPRRMVVVRDPAGNQIGLIDDIGQLDKTSRSIAKQWLEKSYFVPWIKDVVSIQEKLGVSNWRVITNRGERSFEVRNPRRSIRHVYAGTYVVTDVDGNRYRLPPVEKLPLRAQLLLAEFL